MSRNLYKFTEAQSKKVCTRPALRRLLYGYIADLLEDPAAKDVEDHLLDCRFCRERYLKILGLRGATCETNTEHDDEDERAPDDAKVFSLEDFRKERP